MSKYKIRRYAETATIPDTTATVTTPAVEHNGILRGILLDVPQLDGTTTVTFTLKDADGYTIFTQASIAENAKTAIFVDANNEPLQLPLSGNHTMTLLASNTQTTGDKDIPVVLLYERR